VVDVLRTADSRFEDLDDFNFDPNYLDIRSGTIASEPDLRVHYVDQGPKQAAPILMMHGEPTWSYLYRHMIPPAAAAGHRVVAPDLIGFGRSDKPSARSDYTYANHVYWMRQWVEKMDLRDITLVCQDWGGLIGLRLWADMPERFARVVVANTALPTGDGGMPPAFLRWQEFSQSVDPFKSGRIVYGGTQTKLTIAEQAAYDAPFPDARYLAGARMFPMLVPLSPDQNGAAENRAAWQVLRTLETPVLTVFGADDHIMAGHEKLFQALPGAAGQQHVILPNAGHFLQEDVGLELIGRTLDFIAATS
jgi:haloalkane dehalogenase